VSGFQGQSGAVTGLGLFSAAQVAAIRRYCGYGSYAAFGYVLGGSGMATGDYQLAAMVTTEYENVVTYLTSLATLEAAIPAAGQNLDTDQASVWVHNKKEVADRIALYTWHRRELCALLNVPPGPSLAGGNMVVRA